ncbi:MAG TPA: hypothetical protein VNW94_20865, partial [Streptosporangiaceae bacterium]|nr:hypothetical protein [Streptosporangiaceae bacterium]
SLNVGIDTRVGDVCHGESTFQEDIEASGRSPTSTAYALYRRVSGHARTPRSRRVRTCPAWIGYIDESGLADTKVDVWCEHLHSSNTRVAVGMVSYGGNTFSLASREQGIFLMPSIRSR